MTLPAKNLVDGPQSTTQTLTIGKALNLSLRAAMEADEKVIILGEDVGKLGGVFRITDGLQKDFGGRCNQALRPRRARHRSR